MAGIVQGYLRGLDTARGMRREDEAARVAAEELQYRRGRRGVEDMRDDTRFEQGQDDRARMLGEHTEDRAYLTGVERPAAMRRAARAERVGEFEESRMPVKAQQEDAKFAWQMQREQRDAHLDGLRTRLAEYGLDDARLKHEVTQAQRAFQPAVAAFARSRDPRVFAEWANQTVAKDDPITIEQGEDGNWFMQTQTGDRQNLGTAENVMQVARTLTHPEVFLEFQASQLKRQQEIAAKQAENPERFTELVNDEDGRLYMLDTRTGTSRPVMRESGGGVLRGTLAGRFGSREGDRAIPGLRNRQPDILPEDVIDGRGPARASQMRPLAPRPAAQAPAQSAPQRTIVRTGRAPDGRRVAQYSDGTVEYLQ